MKQFSCYMFMELKPFCKYSYLYTITVAWMQPLNIKRSFAQFYITLKGCIKINWTYPKIKRVATNNCLQDFCFVQQDVTIAVFHIVNCGILNKVCLYINIICFVFLRPIQLCHDANFIIYILSIVYIKKCLHHSIF